MPRQSREEVMRMSVSCDLLVSLIAQEAEQVDVDVLPQGVAIHLSSLNGCRFAWSSPPQRHHLGQTDTHFPSLEDEIWLVKWSGPMTRGAESVMGYRRSHISAVFFLVLSLSPLFFPSLPCQDLHSKVNFTCCAPFLRTVEAAQTHTAT